MNTILNNAARSVIFILFTTGLLCILSFGISYGYELFFEDYFDAEAPGFLESAGIIAFFYVLFFGCKYGFKSGTAKMTGKNESKKNKARNTVGEDACPTSENLSPVQKRQLCDMLAKSCGFESPEK